MHRRHLVEEFRMHELQTGLEQLGADDQRHHSANEEHGEREEQIQRSQIFMVGGLDPAHDPLVGAVVVVIVVVISVCVGHLLLLNSGASEN